MKLIGSHASPFVRKVRIVALEKNVDIDLVPGDVMALDSHISAVNPLGKIPCLLLPDGKSLYDSRVIVEYLDSVGSGPSLIPAQTLQRAEIKCWEALADGGLDAGILARWEKVQRKPQHQEPDWTARQLKKVHSSLAAISRQLGSRAFCDGERFTLADA